MSTEFIQRIKREISRARAASPAVISQIEEELQANPSAELWILRGDALQVGEDEEYDLDDVEESYMRALEIDPNSADAHESLGHFTLAADDDPLRAAEYFRRAIELGAGESAREGLREAEEELGEMNES